MENRKISLQQRPKNLKNDRLTASQEREWLPLSRDRCITHGALLRLPLLIWHCHWQSLLIWVSVWSGGRRRRAAIFMTHTIVIHHQLTTGEAHLSSRHPHDLGISAALPCHGVLQRRGNLQGRHERAVKMRTYFTSVPWPDRRNLLVFGECLSNGFDLLVPFRHAAGAAAPQWKPAQGMQCVRVQNFRWAYCTMVKVMSLHWSSQIINMC